MGHKSSTSHAAVVTRPEAFPATVENPPSALEPVQARHAQRKLLTRIIESYSTPIVRAYCRIRFVIIRQDFLNEVGQYLPEEGRVLDIGCGFGLFALYFAGSCPSRQLHGYDLQSGRIAMARQAADATGIHNVRFNAGDALALSLEDEYDGIYALDLIHHLGKDQVAGFVKGLHRVLRPGGVLIIKDVDTRPFYKRWFTLALDRLMVGWHEPIHYWPREDLRALLQAAGFRVYSHTIRDVLPYPHVLHVCWKG